MKKKHFWKAFTGISAAAVMGMNTLTAGAMWQERMNFWDNIPKNYTLCDGMADIPKFCFEAARTDADGQPIGMVYRSEVDPNQYYCLYNMKFNLVRLMATDSAAVEAAMEQYQAEHPDEVNFGFDHAGHEFRELFEFYDYLDADGNESVNHEDFTSKRGQLSGFFTMLKQQGLIQSLTYYDGMAALCEPQFCGAVSCNNVTAETTEIIQGIVDQINPSYPVKLIESISQLDIGDVQNTKNMSVEAAEELIAALHENGIESYKVFLCPLAANVVNTNEWNLMQQGDVNFDGMVDLSDAVSYLDCYARECADMTPLENVYCEDLDGDGAITVQDANIVLNLYAANAADAAE